MRLRFTSSLAFAFAILFTACDEDTGSVGSMLTNDVDQLEVSSSVFKVSSRSVGAEPILARSSLGYLGRIKDPETGAYITTDFMTQFNCLENYKLTPIDSIASYSADGGICADSCEIRLFYEDFYGDSLSLMRLTAYEMGSPMTDAIHYYSDFDPIASGYVREGGIKKEQVFSLVNQADRAIQQSSSYMNNIRVPLNEPYTDADGVTYNNYGTYILRKYYSNPEYFKNGITFTKNVIPGFYFKMTGGMGGMAYVSAPQLNIYYRLYVNKDSIADRMTFFSGTEEVVQSTRVSNDSEILSQLISDESCTYLKGPAGIYTEITLPVADIMKGHENDTVNTARLMLPRYNNTDQNPYNLSCPSQVLLIEKDSLTSFFEHRKIADFKDTYLCSYSSTSNGYTFGNIGSLVSHLYNKMQTGLQSDPAWLEHHPDWNKVLLVPVTSTQYTDTYGYSHYSSVSNDITLSSCRLVGGKDALTLSVIYSRFR